MIEHESFVCGVPECADGYIADQDDATTVVECETHNSRTTYDTHPREVREQEVIRPASGWRQHGVDRGRR
jgi:hypothetical protein